MSAMDITAYRVGSTYMKCLFPVLLHPNRDDHVLDPILHPVFVDLGDLGTYLRIGNILKSSVIS